MRVIGILVIYVHHVDVFHLAPLHTSRVEVGNAIGRQIRDLNAQFIVSTPERITAVEHKRHCPRAAQEFPIEVNTRRLSDIAQINYPFALGKPTRQTECCGIYASSHGHGGFGRKSFPRLKTVHVKFSMNHRSFFCETEFPWR